MIPPVRMEPSVPSAVPSREALALLRILVVAGEGGSAGGLLQNLRQWADDGRLEIDTAPDLPRAVSISSQPLSAHCRRFCSRPPPLPPSPATTRIRKSANASLLGTADGTEGSMRTGGIIPSFRRRPGTGRRARAHHPCPCRAERGSDRRAVAAPPRGTALRRSLPGCRRWRR